MRVEIRAAQPGDGTGLAQVWLENACYYVRRFPDDFQMPDQVGLVESFEARLGRPRSATEIHLVAVVDGVVAAFVSARLTEPDEGATLEMLADRPTAEFMLRLLARQMLSSAKDLQRSSSRQWRRGRESKRRESSAPVRISRARSQSRFGRRGWATDAGPSSSRSVSSSRGSSTWRPKAVAVGSVACASVRE